MSIDFQAIEAQVVRAASLPTRTDVVAACRSLAALTPADKILALRSFVERDRRRWEVLVEDRLNALCELRALHWGMV